MPLADFPGQFMIRHLTDTRELTRQWMEEALFPLSDSLREDLGTRPLEHRSLYCLFYEPSFLTRTSFERAISLLGGHVQFTEDASQFFPVRAGSNIEDTIKFLASLHFDAAVVRSSAAGAVTAAAAADVIPVISGGSDLDHPTQALLDVYTLRRELGRVDGLKIGVVGRVDHRNVNALLMALAKYRQVEVVLFPFSGGAAPEVLDYCNSSSMTLNVESSIAGTAHSFDAIYLNGAETAAHAQLVAAHNLAKTKVDEALLQELRPNCVIMDPMQRTEPLISNSSDTRWAGYRQAENGLFVRMAVLKHILTS